MALPAFQLIPWLLKGLGMAAKKIAPKLLSKAATGSALTKVAGQAMKLIKEGDSGDGALSKVADTVGSGKNTRRLRDVIGAIAGNPLKNLSNKVGQPDLIPPKSTDEMLIDMGQAPQRLSPITPQIDKGDLRSMLDMSDNRKSLRDVLTNIKGSKIGNAAQKLIGGDSFGSKMFLNTLGNMARQGAFSGSDVGQPDKDFGGMLANSLTGALVQSARERRQESYEAEQNMLNMAADINPAEQMYKEYQPKFLDEINSFKNSISQRAIERRKQGGWLTSRDMLEVQGQYMNLKNKMNRFDGDLKAYMDARQKMASDSNGTYDTQAFSAAEGYLRKYGRAPATGFLEAAPKSPEQIFSYLRPTPAGGWVSKSQDEPWVEKSALSSDQKMNLAYAEFLSNPGLRKWAERQGIDLNNDQNIQALASQYYPLIEPDRVNYDVKLRMEDQRLRRQEQFAASAEKAAEKAAKEQEQLNKEFRIVSEYPEAGGEALVFNQNRTVNISPSYLETLTGGKVSASGDVVPVSMEWVNNKGQLSVVAKVKQPIKEDPTKLEEVSRRFFIQPNKAKGFVEAEYPNAWKAAEEKGFFKQKAPSKTPMVYNNDMEDKIEMFMEKNGIKDRDEAVSILREKKIL